MNNESPPGVKLIKSHDDNTAMGDNTVLYKNP